VTGKSNPRETTHTVSPLLVPPCAFNAYGDLPRARRPCSHTTAAMRPTDFCQSTLFLEPVPALSAFGLLGHPSPPRRLAAEKRASGWCDRRVRRFTTCWTRFDGPCGNEAGYSPARALRGGFGPSEERRGLAPYTTSSLTPRHPPGHASAVEGQLAWWPVGSRSLSPSPVKGPASHDPRCLPPPRHRVRPQSLPRRVFRRRRGCAPRASRTIRLSAFERQR